VIRKLANCYIEKMFKYLNRVFVSFLVVCIVAVQCQVNTVEEEVDAKVVKCEVCKVTIQEMENAVSKVNSKKKIEVGGFRIDSSGNTISKTVQFSKSEMYLTELMEKICKKMDDYAKVMHKKTGKVGVIKMMVDDGLNPDISSYDFVQDGDLNKSLEHYCLQILDEFDEIVTEQFMLDTMPNYLDHIICTEKSKLCNDPPIVEDYKLEDEL